MAHTPDPDDAAAARAWVEPLLDKLQADDSCQAITDFGTTAGTRDSELDWNQSRCVLDEAMHELGKEDRDAVLLRFFKNKALKEVGVALCLTENAARMKVDRDLDKLRRLLAKRGVTSTASALAISLGQHGVMASPAGLAAGIASAAVSIATKTTFSLQMLRLMASTKAKI